MSPKHIGILRSISVAWCALAFAPGLGWSQQLTWARQIGAQGNGYSQAVAAGEGVYVTGGIRNSEALPGQVSGGLQDAYLRRYDNDGSTRWTRQFGSAGNDEARGVVYFEGYIYVAGFVEGALPGQTHNGDADAFLRKYDGYGNVLWTRQFGTPQRDEGFAVAVAGGRVYVNGGTRGAFFGYSNPMGNIDTFLRAYDLNGNLLWTRQFARSGNSDDQPAGLAADGAGVYLGSWQLGQFKSDLLRFDTAGNLSYQTAFDMEIKGITLDYGGYLILFRTTSGGAIFRQSKSTNGTLWSRLFGTPAYEPRAVVSDSSGVTLVANTEVYPQNQTGLGPAQVHARRYSGAGDLLWSYEFGGYGWEVPTGVSYAYGALYVAGLTTSWMAGNYQRDGFVVKVNPEKEFTDQIGTALDDQTSGSAAAGAYAYAIGTKWLSPYLRQYRTDGTLGWEREFSNLETLGSVTATGNAIYLSGSREVAGAGRVAWIQRYDLNGTLRWETVVRPVPAVSTTVVSAPYLAASGDFLWATGSTNTAFTQFGQGIAMGTDIYIAGLRPSDGGLLWVRQVGGSSRADYPKGISIAGSGAVVVGSYFYYASLHMIDAYGNLGPRDLRNPPGIATPGETIGVVTTPYGLYTVATGLGGVSATIRRYTTDGTFLWEQPAGLFDATAVSLASDGNSLYVGHNAGREAHVRCYTLNAVPVWNRAILAFQWSAPTMPAISQVLTVAASNGNVYAGGVTNGLVEGATLFHGRNDGWFAKVVGPRNIIPQL